MSQNYQIKLIPPFDSKFVHFLCQNQDFLLNKRRREEGGRRGEGRRREEGSGRREEVGGREIITFFSSYFKAERF